MKLICTKENSDKNMDLGVIALDCGMTFEQWIDRGIMRIHNLNNVLGELEKQKKIVSRRGYRRYSPMVLSIHDSKSCMGYFHDRGFMVVPEKEYFTDGMAMQKVYEMGLEIFPLAECREFIGKICIKAGFGTPISEPKLCSVDDVLRKKKFLISPFEDMSCFAKDCAIAIDCTFSVDYPESIHVRFEESLPF